MLGSFIDFPFESKWDQNRWGNMSAMEYPIQNDYCYFTDSPAQRFTNDTLDTMLMLFSRVVKISCNCPVFHWAAQNPLYRYKLQNFGFLPTDPSIPVGIFFKLKNIDIL